MSAEDDKKREEQQSTFEDIMRGVQATANPFTGLHVAYEQMREAGFSWREACTIIGVWVFNAGQ